MMSQEVTLVVNFWVINPGVMVWFPPPTPSLTSEGELLGAAKKCNYMKNIEKCKEKTTNILFFVFFLVRLVSWVFLLYFNATMSLALLFNLYRTQMFKNKEILKA